MARAREFLRFGSALEGKLLQREPSETFKRHLRPAMEEVSERTYQAVLTGSPVATGHLRDSIRVRVSRAGRRATIGTSVPYGQPIEWGSRVPFAPILSRQLVEWVGAVMGLHGKEAVSVAAAIAYSKLGRKQEGQATFADAFDDTVQTNGRRFERALDAIVRDL